MTKMTTNEALAIRSPAFVYVAEDGQSHQYEIVTAAPQRGLAQRMTPFYQIEKHETDDGVAYIGRIHCTPYIDGNNGLEHLANKGAVLLDEHGRQISPIFDDIDGDIHLGAKLMTRTHEISYSIMPDGTIVGVDYRHPHPKPLEQYSGRREIEGVGLTPLAQALEDMKNEREARKLARERVRNFPLADFFEHKRGDKNEKGE